MPGVLDGRVAQRDERRPGRLTLKYIDIIDAADRQRRSRGLGRAVFLWENVEGVVLTDKTNAFGCFLAGLIGADRPLEARKWPSAGRPLRLEVVLARCSEGLACA